MERTYPQIDVEVNILGSTQTMARLSQGTLDIGLVATPHQPLRNLVVTHWRSDPMMAFVPARWKAPKWATPQWLAAKPLIFNDATTQMYRLTIEWFAAAGYGPRARIELNYTEAMKCLVAAGYGAAVLPSDKPVSEIHSAIRAIPLKPALTRHIAVAHRPVSSMDSAAQKLLQTLALFRQS